jgi:hypothetical protein
MELGFTKVSWRVLLNNIWISVQVALSLLIGHSGSLNKGLLLSCKGSVNLSLSFTLNFQGILSGHHDIVGVLELLIDAIEHILVLALGVVEFFSSLLKLLFVFEVRFFCGC